MGGLAILIDCSDVIVKDNAPSIRHQFLLHSLLCELSNTAKLAC